jgi:hypothetical protein
MIREEGSVLFGRSCCPSACTDNINGGKKMKRLGILSISLVVVFSISGVVSAASFGPDFDWDFTEITGIYHASFDNLIPEDTREFFRIQFDDSKLLNDHGIFGEILAAMNVFGTVSTRWKHRPRRKHPPVVRERPRGPGRPHPHRPAPVPEPGTMILLGMGLVGAAIAGRNKIFKKK